MPITLYRYQPPEVRDKLTGNVKISPEAERVLNQIKAETGLSARHIVSEMVIQGVDYLEVVDLWRKNKEV